jgi:hypothetical protein
VVLLLTSAILSVQDSAHWTDSKMNNITYDKQEAPLVTEKLQDFSEYFNNQQLSDVSIPSHSAPMTFYKLKFPLQLLSTLKDL